MKRISKKLLTGERNFIPTNRRWIVVRRHIFVILKPLLIALLGVILWLLVIQGNHIGFSKNAENPLLFIILPLVSFVYVIFASIAVGSVFNEYKILSRAVVKSDLDTFLLHRDEQLPILMHILVATPSVILIALAMFFHYDDMFVGMAAVFSVIFVVVSTWIVATELDDFQNSIWFEKSIPHEWFEIDVRDYFRKNN